MAEMLHVHVIRVDNTGWGQRWQAMYTVPLKHHGGDV